MLRLFGFKAKTQATHFTAKCSRILSANSFCPFKGVVCLVPDCGLFSPINSFAHLNIKFEQIFYSPPSHFNANGFHLAAAVAVSMEREDRRRPEIVELTERKGKKRRMNTAFPYVTTSNESPLFFTLSRRIFPFLSEGLIFFLPSYPFICTQRERELGLKNFMPHAWMQASKNFLGEKKPNAANCGRVFYLQSPVVELEPSRRNFLKNNSLKKGESMKG